MKKKYLLSDAVLLIADKEYGYVDNLINDLKKEGFVENEEEAFYLIESLSLIGYISCGIDKDHKKTWKATNLAKKEKKYKDFLNNLID